MSFADKLKKHVIDNRGKYSALGALAGTAGLINLGARGYYGSDNQVAIQNTAGKIARNLDASAQRDYMKGNLDTGISIYKRPDTIFTKDDGSIDKQLVIDRVLQQENIPLIGKKIGQTLAEKVGNVSSDPEQLNFMVRNPLFSVGNYKEYNMNSIKGAVDSLQEKMS